MTKTTTYTKTTEGYEVHDSQSNLLGTVSKTRLRTQVMGNDGGRNILLGHTERTSWTAKTPDGKSAGNYHSTRKDAAYWLLYLAEDKAERDAERAAE